MAKNFKDVDSIIYDDDTDYPDIVSSGSNPPPIPKKVNQRFKFPKSTRIRVKNRIIKGKTVKVVQEK